MGEHILIPPSFEVTHGIATDALVDDADATGGITCDQQRVHEADVAFAQCIGSRATGPGATTVGNGVANKEEFGMGSDEHGVEGGMWDATGVGKRVLGFDVILTQRTWRSTETRGGKAAKKDWTQ